MKIQNLELNTLTFAYEMQFKQKMKRTHVRCTLLVIVIHIKYIHPHSIIFNPFIIPLINIKKSYLSSQSVYTPVKRHSNLLSNYRKSTCV